jgi:hypothetical protein
MISNRAACSCGGIASYDSYLMVEGRRKEPKLCSKMPTRSPDHLHLADADEKRYEWLIFGDTVDGHKVMSLGQRFNS